MLPLKEHFTDLSNRMMQWATFRKRIQFVAFIFFTSSVCSIAGLPAFGQINGSAHDFSSYGWSGGEIDLAGFALAFLEPEAFDAPTATCYNGADLVTLSCHGLVGRAVGRDRAGG